MTNIVSCRLEERYINQLKQLSDRTDRTVSRTLRRIVIDALTRRSMSGRRDPKPEKSRTRERRSKEITTRRS